MSKRNPFNLYNPVDPYSDICNVAFSAYAKHSQELEDIIDEIAHGNFEITLDDDFSDSDLDYIEEQLMDRYGIDAELSIGQR